MQENYTREYRQSLTLGLVKVVQELFPSEHFRIAYSILDGVYCELINSILSIREVDHIEKMLKLWVDKNQPIYCTLKEDNLFHCQTEDISIPFLFSTLNSSGLLKHFRLIHYPPGFILQFPGLNAPTHLSHYVPPEKLSATYLESQRWLENVGINDVRDVNSHIENQKGQDLICLAEALHEKKISLIADRIYNQRRNVKIVLISGPSSSGKTTFTQRLSTQLKVNGLRPVSLSLDNYFCAREETPRDQFGQLDFEAIEALDLALLDSHIKTLVKDGEVETPIYDFVSGRRLPSGKWMRLGKDEILLIEGIHALNPHLLPSVDRTSLFKIYVSSLFLLNIDSYNRVPTTDVRQVRRLVRDDKFRGISPEKTLTQWTSVRRGENTNIFPYQEEADVMFNSSLLYELNALRSYVEPLLVSIKPDHPNYRTAEQLLRLLSFFTPLDTTRVPFNSILREFIGESIPQG